MTQNNDLEGKAKPERFPLRILFENENPISNGLRMALEPGYIFRRAWNLSKNYGPATRKALMRVGFWGEVFKVTCYFDAGYNIYHSIGGIN